MFSTDDTIVAIATPPGRGGIGVVRVSGPAAADLVETLTHRESFEPRHATLSTVFAPDGLSIDRVVVTRFPAPHSYTGEDVVELSAHGSPVVLNAIVAAAVAAGARLANPGEFTFRAYLHGRIDLIQAEAIGDLIDAVTPLQARVAFDQLDGTLTARLREMDARLLDLIAPLEASLDFPDEGYHFVTPEDAASTLDQMNQALDALLADARRGRVIREGLTVAIVGRPNAGKSSLFNRLAGAARAIVTDVPGTTRDLLTERVDIGGVPFTLVDTAGLRGAAADAIEEEGIARARQAGLVADMIIVVLDGSMALDDEDRAILEQTAARRRLVVSSKCDLAAAWDAKTHDAARVSALTDEGIGALRDALLTSAGAMDLSRDRVPIANLRHAALVDQARTCVLRARDAVASGLPEELVLADLHEARARFDDLTGARPQDEVLQTIFTRFCIGK
jgi:tRNA modification GTPase